MTKYRVLTTGGRDFTNKNLIREVISTFGPATVFCHGKSPGGGSDALVQEVCDELGFEVRQYPVVRTLDGPWPAAGVKRNQRMLDSFLPDYAIAFPGPKSRGTWDMVRRLEEAHVPFRVYQ